VPAGAPATRFAGTPPFKSKAEGSGVTGEPSELAVGVNDWKAGRPVESDPMTARAAPHRVSDEAT